MADDQNQPVDDLAKKLADAQKHAAEEKEAAAAQGANDEQTNLRLELEQMTELAKRTMADFQNFKRRQDDERRVIITMANVDLIRSLIPITDNLDRALKYFNSTSEDTVRARTNEAGSSATAESSEPINKSWFKGIEMCSAQLHKVLNESGMKPIDSLNQPFNPDLHEALAQGPGPKDIVIEELEKGYMLGDRVIRHAKVKVGDGQT